MKLQLPPTQTHRNLRRLGEDYLRKNLELFPQDGTSYGFDSYDSMLATPTPALWREWNRFQAELLSRVEQIPTLHLSGDDWIDRRALIAHLRTGLQTNAELERWRSNPQLGPNTAADSILRLVVKSHGHLRKTAPDIRARLSLIPEFLAQAAGCLRRPVPLWSRLAIKACYGTVEFLKALEPELEAASGRSVESHISKACTAFMEYVQRVQRIAPGPANGFAVGRANFEMLIRERLGRDWSLNEVEAEGHRLLEHYSKLLREEARASGSGTPIRIIQRLANNWQPDNRPLLEIYQELTNDIRRRLESLNLVTLPKNETLRVVPVPPFMRHQFPTAAYSSAGPFDRKQEGIFWVNDLSLQARSDARKAAERAQHFGMELTCAHEAYPGHHLQFAIQNRHPSWIRRLFAHAIFYEGWTLWCERLAVEHGLFQAPHARLLRLHDAKWRACRIVIDCGLHSGKMNCNQACCFLMQHLGFTRGRASADVNWYTSAPTVPMSYLLGLCEVERLYERKVDRGDWSLKTFNDWMLSYGAVPWAWIEQAETRNALAHTPRTGVTAAG